MEVVVVEAVEEEAEEEEQGGPGVVEEVETRTLEAEVEEPETGGAEKNPSPPTEEKLDPKKSKLPWTRKNQGFRRKASRTRRR